MNLIFGRTFGLLSSVFKRDDEYRADFVCSAFVFKCGLSPLNMRHRV